MDKLTVFSKFPTQAVGYSGKSQLTKKRVSDNVFYCFSKNASDIVIWKPRVCMHEWPQKYPCRLNHFSRILYGLWKTKFIFCNLNNKF